MSANASKRKIKNYLVQKEFQLRLILTNIIVIITTVMTVLGVAFFQSMYKISVVPDIEGQADAAVEFLALFTYLLPSAILIGILFTISIILMTHRICGPIVNIVNTLKRFGEGDLDARIYLRGSDYLKQEAEQINKTMDTIASRLDKAKTSSP